MPIDLNTVSPPVPTAGRASQLRSSTARRWVVAVRLHGLDDVARLVAGVVAVDHDHGGPGDDVAEQLALVGPGRPDPGQQLEVSHILEPDERLARRRCGDIGATRAVERRIDRTDRVERHADDRLQFTTERLTVGDGGAVDVHAGERRHRGDGAQALLRLLAAADDRQRRRHPVVDVLEGEGGGRGGAQAGDPAAVDDAEHVGGAATEQVDVVAHA